MATKISLLNQADDVADQFLRFSNKWLKPTAHVCLLSTFLDDGIRMFFQWNDQVNFFVCLFELGVLGGVVLIVNELS